MTVSAPVNQEPAEEIVLNSFRLEYFLTISRQYN